MPVTQGRVAGPGRSRRGHVTQAAMTVTGTASGSASESRSRLSTRMQSRTVTGTVTVTRTVTGLARRNAMMPSCLFREPARGSGLAGHHWHVGPGPRTAPAAGPMPRDGPAPSLGGPARRRRCGPRPAATRGPRFDPGPRPSSRGGAGLGGAGRGGRVGGRGEARVGPPGSITIGCHGEKLHQVACGNHDSDRRRRPASF